MDRMEHIHGKLYAGDTVLMSDIDGYLGTHVLSKGRTSYYGYFEAPSDQFQGVDLSHPHRLVLDDGRSANIYADVHASNAPGKSVAEFHVTGTFDKSLRKR